MAAGQCSKPAAAVSEALCFGEALRKKLRTKNYLKTATLAFQNRDHNAAIANYQRALEIERSPYVLMALGQVYMQRAASRLRAHQVFTEAVTLWVDGPGMVVPYHHAKLSVRGLAGMQALATADVLSAIHPEHWNDHVRDLVNATVFSFTSAASEQAEQAGDYVSGLVAAQPQFSAAINYYLAAKSACYYPFTEERQEQVVRNAQASLRCLGLMAQYDGEKLRKPAGNVRNYGPWKSCLQKKQKQLWPSTDTTSVMKGAFSSASHIPMLPLQAAVAPGNGRHACSPSTALLH